MNSSFFAGIPSFSSTRGKSVTSTVGLLPEAAGMVMRHWADITITNRFRRELCYARQVVHLCGDRVVDAIDLPSYRQLSLGELVDRYRHPAQRGLLGNKLKNALAEYLSATEKYEELRRLSAAMCRKWSNRG